MTLRIFFGALIPLIFSIPAWAEEVILNPVHPSQYIVAEGDTLWQIAGKFLQKPAQWPLVWRSNPAIKNPNLIYPGDVLAFSVVDGKPQVSIADSSRNNSPVRYEKLSPKIRETSIAQAIKLLPTSEIDQFLSSPNVVNETELESAPYVLSFAGEHIVAGAGERMYVRALPDSKLSNYTVYRKGHAYVDPETQAILGYEAEFIADASLQKAGDPATFLITKAAGEVRSGDHLMASATGENLLDFFPRPPEKPLQGSIISVLNGVSQIGQYNIVVLNKGKSDGLAVGHVLDIYQRGKLVADPFARDKDSAVALPDEMAGSLMVFRVFEHVSYALIMSATQPIHVLDFVKTP